MSIKKRTLKWLILVTICVLVIAGICFSIFLGRDKKNQSNSQNQNSVQDNTEQLPNEEEKNEDEEIGNNENQEPLVKEDKVDNDNKSPDDNQQATNNNQQATNNNQQTTNNNQQTTNNNQQPITYTKENDVPVDPTIRDYYKTKEECVAKGNTITEAHEDQECINGCRIICDYVYGKYTGEVIGFKLRIKIQDGVGTELNF